MTKKTPEESFSEQISSLLQDPDAIKDAAEKAAESVGDYVRKHPYQSVGAALVVGYFLGKWLGNKKS